VLGALGSCQYDRREETEDCLVNSSAGRMIPTQREFGHFVIHKGSQAL